MGGSPVVAVALFIALAAAPVQAATASEQSTCTRKSGQFERGTPVKKQIDLTPDQPTQTVNFGGGRGWQFADVVLKASPPLPRHFRVAQLDIEVLRRVTRQSESLVTVSLLPLTFTQPRLNPRRDRIVFTICVNGSSIDAGHYAGAITIEGPKGIGPTNVALNVTQHRVGSRSDNGWVRSHYDGCCSRGIPQSDHYGGGQVGFTATFSDNRTSPWKTRKSYPSVVTNQGSRTSPRHSPAR